VAKARVEEALRLPGVKGGGHDGGNEGGNGDEEGEAHVGGRVGDVGSGADSTSACGQGLL
jgi:hypothetical protein